VVSVEGMSRPRITPAGWLAVAATVVYAVMWLAHAQAWGWLHTADWSLLNPAHDIGIKSRAWVRFWDDVSFVLGPVPLRLLGGLAAVVSAVRREARMALLLLFCAPLSGLVTWAAKGLAGRPRPMTALVVAPSTSFPSGHALEATASLLALLTFLLPMVASRALRVAAVAVAVVGVVMVSIARVALNVHHPSDVIAGWALGFLYFLLCLWVFRPPPLVTARDTTGSKPLLDPKAGAR